MPSFSKRSKDRLAECHPDLQQVFEQVIKHYDCTILCGRRGEGEQNRAFYEGRSKLRYPDSKHNKSPSLAVDVAPWPIDWADRERWLIFGGIVLGIAATMGVDLRWGGDWNGNLRTSDQSFHDLPHFELR